MLRRNFIRVLACLACPLGWLIVGCRRETPRQPTFSTAATPVPFTELEMAQLVRQRISQRLDTSTQFDPFTIIAIVGFVLRVIQACHAMSVTSQHATVKRFPRGATASRMSRRLHERYMRANPDASHAEVTAHIDAAMHAFADATPEEIRDIKTSLDAANKQPTELDLFHFTEALSQ